jgi:DNA-binding transcriptional LysR family regulator
MEMYQVRYFLSVARVLNFTRAAEECDVAQPSLSRAIKQLEAELGGELFRRERPQAILTELGHRMLPILTRCYDSANNARALAAAVKEGESGALRVALSPTINLGLLLPHFRELSRIFDGLTYFVRRGSAAETLESLKAGEAEIAIVAAKEEAQTLETTWLFDEDFSLMCGRAHRMANRAKIDLAELRAERLVLARHAEHAVALEATLKGKLRLEHCHETFSDDDLIQLVVDGAGIAIVPRSLPTPDTAVLIPIEGLDLRRTVSFFCVPGRPRSVVSTTLTNLLRAADWLARPD